MPSCVPANNNNVGDADAVKRPPQSDSKISKLITCLFFRKKTGVVDLAKESSAAARKKQRMTVDRSERSRRVLKMESMRTAPKSRDDDDASRPSSGQGPTQMFLPSENPTASFLSHLNPSVRRACSDVIRTSSSSNGGKSTSREAFSENGRIPVTRNTNYRGKQTNQKGHHSFNDRDKLGKPPKPPERHSSTTSNATGGRRPVVVPGLMSASDDDVGYDSEDEITDIHEEMRRMNLSQPDLRSSTSDKKPSKPRRRRREASESISSEGSISLSEEESESDEETDDTRPQNPSPSEKRGISDAVIITNDVTTTNVSNSKTHKTKSMEDVIDDLFKQTQNNIDTIYKTGLDNMDLETYRSDTVTPDTCMRRLEEDLMKEDYDSEDSENLREKKKPALPTRPPPPTPANFKKNHGMDTLLNEVSLWASDRQKWLLEDGGKIKAFEPGTRESTVASFTTDGQAIDQVTKTNTETNATQRCSHWVNELDKDGDESGTVQTGILTAPKLFRSTAKFPTTPRHPERRRVSFNGNEARSSSFNSPKKSESTRTTVPRKRTYRGVQVLDYGNDETEVVNDPVDETTGLEIKDLENEPKCPEPWTSDMYKNHETPTDEKARSSLKDSSELDDSKIVNERTSSPDSWLGSDGSCSNMETKKINEINDGDDCYEVPYTRKSPYDRSMVTPEEYIMDKRPNVVKATNVGKSHQIERKSPKVHSFRELEKQFSISKQPSLPVKPMMRNTQLKPINSLQIGEPKNIETFPALPGMKSSSHSFNKSRNVSSLETSLGHLASQANRPFSEIPLRPDFSSDRNSNMLASRVNMPKGPDASHPVIQSMMRPVSETVMPLNKRLDKIGMGPIMATKDKQAYAQNIANAIEKQRLQPNENAFKAEALGGDNRENDDKTTDEKKNMDSTKRRHKVFSQGLLDGGYNYNKHSRRRHAEPVLTESCSFTEKHNSGDPLQLNQSRSFRTSQPPMASVNDLCLSIQDSIEKPPNGLSFAHNTISEPSNGKNGNAKLQRNHSMQVHNIGGNIQQYHENGANTKTADKFRKLRTRRDIEMDWLMKDAAETEL